MRRTTSRFVVQRPSCFRAPGVGLGDCFVVVRRRGRRASWLHPLFLAPPFLVQFGSFPDAPRSHG